MNTRILRITNPESRQWFAPQWSVDNRWMDFFGFDDDSPYLHVRLFDDLDKAKAFLLQPAIYNPGNGGTRYYATVVEQS